MPAAGSKITAALTRGSWTGGPVGTSLFSKLLAGAEAISLAAGQVTAEVRIAADDDEACVAPHRESEQANTPAVDLRFFGPAAEHEIQQARNIGGALHEHGQFIDTALIEGVVARMIDGGDHISRICQDRRSVVVGTEPRPPAMRDHDERKPALDNSAVLRGE
jgi:hypothetical protein